MEQQQQATTTTPEIPVGYHSMAVMDGTGDTKKIWNPRIPAEVDDAEASFDRLRAEGYLAFSVSPDGSQGEQIHAFDADAGKMILIPQMQGG